MSSEAEARMRRTGAAVCVAFEMRVTRKEAAPHFRAVVR